MEGIDRETSPDYKMTNFPNKWCSAKVVNGFSATALTAYALELPYTVATLNTIAYDNF
jgi:hypothetical protein